MPSLRSVGISIAVSLTFCGATGAAATQSSAPHTAAPLLWGDLKPGQFAVGFKTLYLRDKSRPWLLGHAGSKADPGRPIRISIWYPSASASSGVPMRYGDYFHYDGPADFRALNAKLEANDRQSYLDDFNAVTPRGQELLAKLVATPVAAHHNARAVQGRFPVVLYAGGEGSRADANVPLAEFLASHGYVVATVPPLGPSEDDLNQESTPKDVALRVSDFEFALGTLRKLSFIDGSRVAIAGHSVGGDVALDMAMRHSNIRAVIGLDGSFGFTGRSDRFKRIAGYAPQQIKAAILDMRRGSGVQGATDDSSVLEACTSADRYQVTFRHMFHGDFTEFGPVGLKLAVPLPPNTDGRTRLTGYQGNQEAYHLALDFLDAHLRGQSAAMGDFVSTAAKIPDAELLHASPGSELATVHRF
jgi:dienelactone hydrolase